MKLSCTLVAPIAVIAACFHPEAPLGLPCSTNLECPSGQLCVANAAGGPRCEDTATANLPGPPNDLPEGAIDVSAGGTFMFDLSNAHDDAASGCAPARPEVFYRLSLSEPEVLYLDTFGSAADTAIAIRSGSCTATGNEEACVDDSCGSAQSQGAWSLAAGDHCIVVEGAANAVATSGQLVVVRGRHDGDPLTAVSGSVSGNTCNDNNSNNAGCGCEPAKDHHYYFTVCPNTMVAAHVETCGATWDTVVQLRAGAGMSLGCDDDTCGTGSSLTRTLTGPGMFWAIIDGCDECGAYTLAYDLAAASAPALR